MSRFPKIRTCPESCPQDHPSPTCPDLSPRSLKPMFSQLGPVPKIVPNLSHA